MKSLLVMTAVVFFFSVNPAFGKTDVCAEVKGEGVLYGLCVSYEALDCDQNLTKGKQKACELIEDKYYQISGEVIPARNCPGWTTAELNKIFSRGCDGIDVNSRCENDHTQDNYNDCNCLWDVEDAGGSQGPGSELTTHVGVGICDDGSSQWKEVWYVDSFDGPIINRTVYVTDDQFEACRQEIYDHVIPLP